MTDDCMSGQKHSSTTVDRATRCGFRQLIPYCSTATQVDLHPSTRDMGTQCEESDVLWHSTPLSPVSSLEPLDDQEESYDPFDESEPMSIDDFLSDDGYLEDELGCQNPQANKYIVCHSELMELFCTCICGEWAEAAIAKKSGTFIEIQQVGRLCICSKVTKRIFTLFLNLHPVFFIFSSLFIFFGCVYSRNVICVVTTDPGEISPCSKKTCQPATFSFLGPYTSQGVWYLRLYGCRRC
nr:uncharacterized protein LOC107384595 isoform X1 [Nothobranchius furzeri]